jgi:hypothetical protein
MKFIFVADVFIEDGILGGGELNNHIFCEILHQQGHTIRRIHSHELTLEVIEENKREYDFVIANFLNIKPDVISAIRKLTRYVIYEHDHKYLRTRNPALYEDFLAPVDQLVYHDFYSSALAVLCQSSMHKDIVEKNLKLNNIHNLSGNLWSNDILDFIEKLSKNKKSTKCSIMESTIEHKNTSGAVKYCILKEKEYDLISPSDYKKFLDKLSQNQSLVFFPKTPETLSRIIIEARMLGCKILTNDLIGAIGEEWFELKGKELIDKMRQKRNEIPDFVLSFFEEE